MSRIFRQGIRFTHTLNTGIGTRHGQIAAQCSLPAFEDFPMMAVASAARAVCLSDIFASRGYFNLFGYGSTNQFDSQYDFYSAHSVEKIFGAEAFDSTAARGLWGFSDMALANKALDLLDDNRSSGRPFFATILTLSNHGPQKLPDDAPASLDRSLNEREQLLAYVDWVFGQTYERISKNHPHTIVINLADHGLWYEDVVGTGEDQWKTLSRVNRIPFTINIPNLPPELAGEVGTLASNADLAPTLLSLLGIFDEPNQFFGVDAFSRTTPILINIYEKTYTLAETNSLGKKTTGAEKPVEMERAAADTIGALPRFNLLKP